jgi:hypothetical protein
MSKPVFSLVLAALFLGSAMIGAGREARAQCVNCTIAFCGGSWYIPTPSFDPCCCPSHADVWGYVQATFSTTNGCLNLPSCVMGIKISYILPTNPNQVFVVVQSQGGATGIPCGTGCGVDGMVSWDDGTSGACPIPVGVHAIVDVQGSYIINPVVGGGAGNGLSTAYFDGP